MSFLLLFLISLCCGAIGYAVATTHGNAWSMVIYSVAALVSLQIVYLLTLVMQAEV